MAQQFYDNSGIAQCQALQNLIDKYKINYVIIENESSLNCLKIEKTYMDNLYQMYKVIDQ